MALLECCLSNVSSDARVALNDADYEVREAFCLDRCGRCYDDPFLVIDGKVRTGESHRDLLRALDGEPQVGPE